MKNRLFLFVGFLVLAAMASLFGGHSLFAQSDEKSTLIRFVEEQLSAPNRKISLNGLEGALSSDVALDSIQIADADGVWLRIEKPRLVWNRTALFLGRLEITELTAERIDFPRKPKPDTSMPAPEARSFKLPELPVAVRLDRLSVPQIVLGQEAIGLAAEAAIDGRMALSDGNLDFDLNARRLGPTGGALTARINYDGGRETIALDVLLDEPENGILTNALAMRGRPPVRLELRGEGPIDTLDATLGLDVAGENTLDGRLTFKREGSARAGRLTVQGPITGLFSAEAQAFFGNDTALTSDFVLAEDGALDVRSFRLSGGSVAAEGALSLLSDGFVSKLAARVNLRDPAGQDVILPVQGAADAGAGDGATALRSAALDLDYDLAVSPDFRARLAVDALRSPSANVEAIVLDLGGRVDNFRDAARRMLAFTLNGTASGLTDADGATVAAFGDGLTLDGSGFWQQGAPLAIERLRLKSETIESRLSGTVSGTRFKGELDLRADDMAVLAPLIGHNIAGPARFALTGSVDALSGGFDLALDGDASVRGLGRGALDALFAGETSVTGGVKRGEEGLAITDLKIGNPQLVLNADGGLSSDFADLRLEGMLLDVAVVEAQSSGAVGLDLELSGDHRHTPRDAPRPYALQARLSMPQGALVRRPVDQLALAFNGLLDGQTVDGRLSSSGQFDEKPFTVTGALSLSEKTSSLSQFLAEIAAARLSGDLARGADGLLAGAFAVASPDIGPLAALALQEMSGRLDGMVTLSTEGGTQALASDIKLNAFRYQSLTIGKADAQATIRDLFGVPAVNLAISGDGAISGTTIRRFAARAATNGQATEFSADARIAARAETVVKATGSVLPASAGTTVVTLQSLSAVAASVDMRLTAPARVLVSATGTRIEPIDIAVGNGRIEIAGDIGERLDLRAVIEALPLAVANGFVADLGGSGTLNGTLGVAGTRTDPTATFALSGSSISGRPLSQVRLSPLAIKADGTVRGRTVTLSTATVTNSDGLSVRASGTVPLSGGGLDLAANGRAPLALGNVFLIERGTRLAGAAEFRLGATGSLAAPRIDGLVTINGGEITDPATNVKLEDIGVLAGLRGQTLTITRASGRLARGGTVTASGSIGLTGDLPLDLALRLDNAAYSDGELIKTVASGALQITGSVGRDPLVAGRIDLAELTIAVPENFAGSAELLDVRHINPDPLVAQTLRRLGALQPKGASVRQSDVRLAIALHAPRRIFVRGRGLDAELGGVLQLNGSVSAIEPVGAFNLIRGRLEILGQRLDLVSGRVTFAGDLDPVLDFVASSKSGDVEAFITISGPASEPSVKFTSTPELPEDEVLARLIFDRGIADLSPTQIARLASAVTELAGGPKVSIIDNIRSNIGLDDLDIVEDDRGGTAVRAGKYINDNVYVGVETGAETEATINIDITDDITARGAVGSDGKTTIGVFFERDY